MRIVLVSDYYAPHVGGGVERVVEELAHHLARFGHEVRVLTFKPNGLPSKETVQGVDIVRLPALNLQPIVGFPAALNASLGLRSYLDGADVIHVHNIFFLLSLLAVLSRPRAPIITTMHLGSLSKLPGLTGLLARTYEETLGGHILHSSAAVTGVSASVVTHAADLGARGPVQLIPNTVDVERFKPPVPNDNDGSHPSVLFLGRFSRNKGPQYLLEAIPQVMSEVPDASFCFVGEGPLRDVMVRRTSELRLNGNVRILGKVPDVVPLLQNARVVVRPSLTEGMPLAVMEAMACGKPVLASRIGGTMDVIHDGETGILFEAGSVESLVDGLIRVLRDGEQAAAIGRRAREWAEQQMTWERVSRMYEKLYREVAA